MRLKNIHVLTAIYSMTDQMADRFNIADNSGIQGYGGISRVRLTGCVESLRIGEDYIDLIRDTQMQNVHVGCSAPPQNQPS